MTDNNTAIKITNKELDELINKVAATMNAADSISPAMIFEDVAFEVAEMLGEQVRAVLAGLPRHAANDRVFIKNCVKRQKVRLLREEADNRAKSSGGRQ